MRSRIGICAVIWVAVVFGLAIKTEVNAEKVQGLEGMETNGFHRVEKRSPEEKTDEPPIPTIITPRPTLAPNSASVPTTTPTTVTTPTFLPSTQPPTTPTTLPTTTTTISPTTSSTTPRTNPTTTPATGGAFGLSSSAPLPSVIFCLFVIVMSIWRR